MRSIRTNVQKSDVFQCPAQKCVESSNLVSSMSPATQKKYTEHAKNCCAFVPEDGSLFRRWKCGMCCWRRDAVGCAATRTSALVHSASSRSRCASSPPRCTPPVCESPQSAVCLETVNHSGWFKKGVAVGGDATAPLPLLAQNFPQTVAFSRIKGVQFVVCLCDK